MKKFFALMLALVMALSLVACGSKADTTADDKTDNHKDRTYFSTNKRLYDPCDYQTCAYDQCSKLHYKAVRLLILFGNLTAIIPMNRGYVATHIKYSQYSYNRT